MWFVEYHSEHFFQLPRYGNWNHKTNLVNTEMFRHGGFNTIFTVEVSILTLTEGKLLCFLHKFQTMNLKIWFSLIKISFEWKYISSAFTDKLKGLFYISLLFISMINMILCISASLSDATCWQSDLTEIGTWRWSGTSGVLKADRRKLLFVIQTQRSVRKLVLWDQLSSLRSSILRVAWRKSWSLTYLHLPLREALKQTDMR